MKFENFQLIDRVVEINTADRSIRCEAIVPTESTIFEAHFPTFPLMPGVLLIEAMAQTSGWLILAIQKFERMPFLAALREVKLRTFVTPGQRMMFSARLEHDGSGFAVTEAKGEFDGKVACDATIVFRVIEFPNPEFKKSMKGYGELVDFPKEMLGHD
jgi:3-hydroxyacyl-[acyl-carrier-protein] dehydratase